MLFEELTNKEIEILSVLECNMTSVFSKFGFVRTLKRCTELNYKGASSKIFSIGNREIENNFITKTNWDLSLNAQINGSNVEECLAEAIVVAIQCFLEVSLQDMRVIITSKKNNISIEEITLDKGSDFIGNKDNNSITNLANLLSDYSVLDYIYVDSLLKNQQIERSEISVVGLINSKLNYIAEVKIIDKEKVCINLSINMEGIQKYYVKMKR